MGRKAVPLVDRLWAKIVLIDDCWIYGGGKFKSVYATISDNYLTRTAHRVSYELHRGSVPAGLLVLHRCDNPHCVNPDHLFLGTQQDNMNDKVQKGRHRNQWTAEKVK